MENTLRDLVVAIGEALSARPAAPSDAAADLLAGLRADFVAAEPADETAGAAARTVDAVLADISGVFGLDDIAARALVVAAAADIDPRFTGLYGVLTGAADARRATVGLLLELTGQGHRSATGRRLLGASGPLQRQGLMQVDGDGPLLWRTARVPDRITAHLIGDATPTPAVIDVTVQVPAPITDQARYLAGSFRRGVHMAHVRARPAGLGLSLGAAAFTALDVTHLVADLTRCPAGTPAAPLIADLVREAALQRACLVLAGVDELLRDDPSILAIMERGPMPVVVVDDVAWEPDWCTAPTVTMIAEPLGPVDREDLWRQTVPQLAGRPADTGWVDLVGLRLTPQQIVAAADAARFHGAFEEAEGAETVGGRDRSLAALHDAARAFGGKELHHAAVRVRPKATLADLVLAPAAREELGEFASWARYRETLLSQGSLGGKGTKGRGLTALFTGSPGTGKTLAAEAIAGELGVDLYVVEVSTVIDKYIGETEKKLERVISEAESLNVVLFFDEADALFGSRAEVRDARDRYANQGVSYLLQRIERFDGIAILATNLRGNIDTAFSRRLHHIVTFLDPDVPTRKELWRSHLEAVIDLDPDDLPDIDLLAERIDVTGGTVRNIVLAAAFTAVSSGEKVGMRHVHHGVRRELTKLGRRVDEGLLGESRLTARGVQP